MENSIVRCGEEPYRTKRLYAQGLQGTQQPERLVKCVAYGQRSGRGTKRTERMMGEPKSQRSEARRVSRAQRSVYLAEVPTEEGTGAVKI